MTKPGLGPESPEQAWSNEVEPLICDRYVSQLIVRV